MKAWGTGSIYRRSGGVFWIQYSHRGRVYRESSRSRVRADAAKLLRRRLAEMAGGRLVGPDADKVPFGDLVELIRADYERKQNRTWERVEHALMHLRQTFEKLPASAITFDSVSRYISKRLAQGAARGTIHHEVAALGRMLKLGVVAGRLYAKPVLPTLKLDNVRKGFFTDDEVRRVLAKLPDWYAPAIEFGWRTGWRIGEVKSLAWSQVDFRGGVVRLEPGTTKNREGRTFPFAAFPALAALLRRQREQTLAWQRGRGEIVPWVFWREGRKLGDHRDVWNRCCREAGVPGRLVHDLRRSAVRNLERAGVPRSSAMKLTGHLTESVYRRYAIVSEADLAEAVRRLAAFQQAQVPTVGTSTELTQSGSSRPGPRGVDGSTSEAAATGTHGYERASGDDHCAADLPATVPLLHAHWKLNGEPGEGEEGAIERKPAPDAGADESEPTVRDP